MFTTLTRLQNNRGRTVIIIVTFHNPEGVYVTLNIYLGLTGTTFLKWSFNSSIIEENEKKLNF